MSAGGMYRGQIYKPAVRWQEVPGIYKARFRSLWQVLRLSLSAALIALVIVILIPLIFGFALFSGHVILTATAVLLALLVPGRLYWISLKQAFNITKRR